MLSFRVNQRENYYQFNITRIIVFTLLNRRIKVTNYLPKNKSKKEKMREKIKIR